MKKIIIIPDVHGRKFWKEAVEQRDDAKVIFLGDYLDPYWGDKTVEGDPVENFKEIVEYKEKNPDTTVMLVGNHDRHYMDGCSQTFSRFNYGFYFRSRKENLFERADLKAVHEEDINGKKFLFSHGGISQHWLKYVYGEDAVIDVNTINEGYKKGPGCYDMMIPILRGGTYSYGSPIWNDFRDFTENDVTEYIQIIGHTQTASDPILIFDSIYDLDCRRAFYIDENGDLKEMNGDPIKVIKK